MEIRPVDKLILTLLIDLHRANNISSSLDTDFVEEIIDSNNHWALSWQYPGMFPDEKTPSEVKEVCNILDMWDHIEYSYQILNQTEKELIVGTLKSEPKFKGFDGNNEYKQLGIIDILVNKMDRYQFLKNRYINSHMPMIDIYQNQLVQYNEITEQSEIPSALTAENIIEIIRRGREW